MWLINIHKSTCICSINTFSFIQLLFLDGVMRADLRGLLGLTSDLQESMTLVFREDGGPVQEVKAGVSCCSGACRQWSPDWLLTALSWRFLNFKVRLLSYFHHMIFHFIRTRVAVRKMVLFQAEGFVCLTYLHLKNRILWCSL